MSHPTGATECKKRAQDIPSHDFMDNHLRVQIDTLAPVSRPIGLFQLAYIPKSGDQPREKLLIKTYVCLQSLP